MTSLAIVSDYGHDPVDPTSHDFLDYMTSHDSNDPQSWSRANNNHHAMN